MFYNFGISKVLCLLEKEDSQRLLGNTVEFLDSLGQKVLYHPQQEKDADYFFFSFGSNKKLRGELFSTCISNIN